MIRDISIKLAGTIYQLQDDPPEMEILAYGMEILLGSLLKFAAIVTVSWLMGTFYPTMFCLLGFAGFRLFGGGVHLSTYWRCFFIGLTVILLLGVLSTFPNSDSSLILLIFLTGVMAICNIIFWVPAGTEKKRITDPELRLRQKGKTLFVLLAWLFIVIICIAYKHIDYTYPMVLGALWGNFLITPFGYWFIQAIDRNLDRIERR